MNKYFHNIIMIFFLTSKTALSTRVSLVEVEMFATRSTFNAVIHQGLRFQSGFESSECHFGPRGLQVCQAGKFDNGSRLYTAEKHLGEVDKSINECEEWCKKWARKNRYGVGSLCWTLVGEFARAHGLKKHAAVRDPKPSEDCCIQ